MLTSTAVSDLNTLLSMAMPLRVKAYGFFLVPLQLDVTNCDFKLSRNTLSGLPNPSTTTVAFRSSNRS